MLFVRCFSGRCWIESYAEFPTAGCKAPPQSSDFFLSLVSSALLQIHSDLLESMCTLLLLLLLLLTPRSEPCVFTLLEESAVFLPRVGVKAEPKLALCRLTCRSGS